MGAHWTILFITTARAPGALPVRCCPPHRRRPTMLRLLCRPCSQQQLLRAGKAISSGATHRVPAGVPTPSSDDPASSNAVQLGVLLGSSVLLQLGAGTALFYIPRGGRRAEPCFLAHDARSLHPGQVPA